MLRWVKGCLCGRIVDKQKVISNWIRFDEVGLSCLLEGLESSCRKVVGMNEGDLSS